MVRRHVATLRGASRLAIDATGVVTDLVESLHRQIAQPATQAGGPLVGAAVTTVTGAVYASVRGVTRAVGAGLDIGLIHLERSLAVRFDEPTGRFPLRGQAALRSAVNGVLGDYLAATANPLAIPLALRRDGIALAPDRSALRQRIGAPRATLIVMVHGLCMSDLQWRRQRPSGAWHDHGAALEQALDATAVYLHYNSGLHISTNAQAFAGALETLVAAWPVKVDQIVIVGHSMGGLVARSAVHYGALARHAWTRRVRALAFLGTPHQGAPLERGGHWIDLLLQSRPYTAPFARLGRVRSAGITDVRHGSVLDDDWHGRDRFAHPAADNAARRHPLPLPAEVSCYAIAATRSARPSGQVGAPRLAGDGLVPVASALGHHPDPRLALAFPPAHQWIAPATDHWDLLSSAAVYRRLLAWLGAVRPAALEPRDR